MISPAAIMPIPALGILPLTKEKEAEQRLRVITECKKWIRTPYHQQSDKIGAGVDCSMILVRAWVDAGIFEPFDPRPYPSNWHFHQDEERYLEWMETLAEETITPQPGDIRLMTFGRCYSHSGIITRPGVMLHAHQRTGMCCESDMSENWVTYFDKGGTRIRPFKYFDIWAKIRKVYPQ